VVVELDDQNRAVSLKEVEKLIKRIGTEQK
jgi:hypothetical protein